jgi:hypothetical protein
MSMYRIHDSHKTGTGGDKRMLEIEKMLQKYSGQKILDAYIFMRDNKEKINSVLKKVGKYKLTRFDMKILRIIYPTKFLSIPDIKLRQLYELG